MFLRRGSFGENKGGDDRGPEIKNNPSDVRKSSGSLQELTGKGRPPGAQGPPVF